MYMINFPLFNIDCLACVFVSDAISTFTVESDIFERILFLIDIFATLKIRD